MSTGSWTYSGSIVSGGGRVEDVSWILAVLKVSKSSEKEGEEGEELMGVPSGFKPMSASSAKERAKALLMAFVW